MTPTLRLRAAAALLLHPSGACISHTTAASLQEIAVPHDPVVHVTVPEPGLRRRRNGLSVHVRADAALRTVRGLPVSTGSELIAELAQVLCLVDLVAAADSMVHSQRISPEELIPETGRGIGPARVALSLVRAGVESRMETKVRLLLIWAGFPEPEVNITVRTGGGTFRLDLAWPELRLAVEYDGQHHRTDQDQWASDIRRREWLQRDGWSVVTLLARDLYRRPADALARVYRAWLDSEGKPFAMLDDWRHHFGAMRAA